MSHRPRKDLEGIAIDVLSAVMSDGNPKRRAKLLPGTVQRGLIIEILLDIRDQTTPAFVPNFPT